jgi:hypothetical protein
MCRAFCVPYFPPYKVQDLPLSLLDEPLSEEELATRIAALGLWNFSFIWDRRCRN